MLKYVLFQHLTRILLQYICNANEIQNKVQERSDGALDANEGQGHEQCCRYRHQASRHREEQDGIGQHAPCFDTYRTETDESEKYGAEYDEKDDPENCGDKRRSIGENPVSAVADEGMP